MRVIRPVEHADIAALMQLAGKTGGGLTSLPLLPLPWRWGLRIWLMPLRLPPPRQRMRSQ